MFSFPRFLSFVDKSLADAPHRLSMNSIGMVPGKLFLHAMVLLHID